MRIYLILNHNPDGFVSTSSVKYDEHYLKLSIKYSGNATILSTSKISMCY